MFSKQSNGIVKIVLFLFSIITVLSFSVHAENQHFKAGYPCVESEVEIQKSFNSPPSGYGESPFFWWSGVKLSREYLSEQLDQLQKAGVYGLVVSYHQVVANLHWPNKVQNLPLPRPSF